jgi:hypothetical protein
MEDAICLAFDTIPSDITRVFWKVTRNDIRVKVRLYLGERYARIIQDYQSYSLATSYIFGGKSKKRSSVNDEDIPKTAAQAKMAFKSVFG